MIPGLRLQALAAAMAAKGQPSFERMKQHNRLRCRVPSWPVQGLQWVVVVLRLVFAPGQAHRQRLVALLAWASVGWAQLAVKAGEETSHE